MSVVIVGSVALDTVVTPAGRREEALGGSAAYACCAASLFTQARLVGIVGEDFPQEHRAFLESRGMDLSSLAVAPGRTFRWGGTYFDDDRERRTDFTDLGVFAEFSPVLGAVQRQAETVFLANIHPRLQLQVVEQMESPRLTLADTMNLWLDTAREEVMTVLDRVDVALMNDSEVRRYSGVRSIIAAGRRLRERHGLLSAVVKKGEHGAVVVSADDLFFAPAYPLDSVTDPTGAGDAFGGALSGYLDSQPAVSPATFRLAVLYGTVVASFVVQAFSLDGLRTLTRSDVDARLRELLAMIRVPEFG